MSESLISLTKNEQMSESLIFLSEPLIRSFLKKMSASLGNQMSEFPALQSRAMTTFELFSLNPIEEGVAALVRLVVGGRGGGRGRLMLVGG